MEEQEYYNNNKHKIKFNDISTWKYYPIGNSMRKTYDYYNINLADFLILYYKEYDETNWNRWINTIVKPLFNGDYKNWKRIDYKYQNIDDMDNFISWFEEKQQKMKNVYVKLKSLYKLDDKILLFISYLSSMNFFEEINMMINEWLENKNYNLGGRNKSNPDIYSLKEISQYAYGENLIKEKLMNLDWHKK